MYVRPTSARLLSGMLTPEIRAMCLLLALDLSLAAACDVDSSRSRAPVPHDGSPCTSRTSASPKVVPSRLLSLMGVYRYPSGVGSGDRSGRRYRAEAWRRAPGGPTGAPRRY